MKKKMKWRYNFLTVTGAGSCSTTSTWRRERGNNLYYRIVSVNSPVKLFFFFFPPRSVWEDSFTKAYICVKQVTCFRITKPNLLHSWLSPLMLVSRSLVCGMTEPCTEAHGALKNLSPLLKKLPHQRFDVLCSNAQALPPVSDCSSPIRRTDNPITPAVQSQLRH